MDFEQKLARIERIIEIEEHSVAAKECVGLIEQALRQLFSRHLTQLEEQDRLKVQKAESEIGKGIKGIESFTMGQLVGVFRKSRFLDAWARVSGKDLGSLRLINLDELTRFRNTFIHGEREATRSEAEFLFHCLQVILESSELSPTSSVSPKSEKYIQSNKGAAALVLKGKDKSDDRDRCLLFVSYVHANNQAPPGETEGWVAALINRLKILLSQKLAREDIYALWIDDPLDGNDNDRSIVDTLSDSATFLTILSREYLASAWCQRGENGFLSIIQERGRRDSSVFVIERDRLHYEERPPEFAEITGYRYPFWDEPRYHSLLNDLSYDLAGEFQRQKNRAGIRNNAPGIPPDQPLDPSLAPDTQTIGILLFLDANIDQDQTLVSQICQELEQCGVGYMLPLQSAKPAENREAFEQYVLNCDALVVVYGEVSVKWVSDQLLAMRKIFWKREQPLTFAIFDGPPEDKPPLNIKLPNMRVLQCRNFVDKEKLLSFIAPLAK